MFIIKSGVLEVILKVDNSEVVIERLYRGSIINYRSFLVGDISDVSGRCATAVTLFYLSFDKLQEIRMKSLKIHQSIAQIESEIVSKDNPYSIDYIQCKSVYEKVRRPLAVENRRLKLTFQLKNAVIYYLSGIKSKKKKISFKEIIGQVIAKKKEEIKSQRKKKMHLMMGELIENED